MLTQCDISLRYTTEWFPLSICYAHHKHHYHLSLYNTIMTSLTIFPKLCLSFPKFNFLKSMWSECLLHILLNGSLQHPVPRPRASPSSVFGLPEAHGSLIPQESKELLRAQKMLFPQYETQCEGHEICSGFCLLIQKSQSSSEQESDYKNAMFMSAVGPLFACLQCLGRKHDAYSIYIFHAVVNLEPSPSSRQNKFTPAQISWSFLLQMWENSTEHVESGEHIINPETQALRELHGAHKGSSVL